MNEKDIPYQVKIDELMEARTEISNSIDEIVKKMEEIQQPFIEEMNKATAKLDIRKEELSIKLDNLEDTMESIMKENNLTEYEHQNATIIYKGRRSVDMNKAKTWIPSDKYKAIVKESITVGTAEKILDPKILENIIVEGKKQLKFNKPKNSKSKKRGSITEVIH